MEARIQALIPELNVLSLLSINNNSTTANVFNMWSNKTDRCLYSTISALTIHNWEKVNNLEHLLTNMQYIHNMYYSGIKNSKVNLCSNIGWS